MARERNIARLAVLEGRAEASDARLSGHPVLRLGTPARAMDVRTVIDNLVFTNQGLMGSLHAVAGKSE
ncbi:MAG: hypothetical protein Kow00104_01950 [Rhodothalassiaceae bacterium]